MTKFFKLAATLLVLLVGCQPGTNQISDEAQDACVREYCEGPTMSTVLTDTPANANFTTGVTYPTSGDAGTIWWGLVQGSVQQLSDRSAWLKGWHPDTPVIRIPLSPASNASSRFAAATGTAAAWSQTDVTSTGGLLFSLSGMLPAGRKINAVTATIQNESTTNVSIGTKPAIELKRQICTSGGAFSSFGVVTDPTAVLATYQANHDFGITGLNHTIDANSEYAILFTGETGANSIPGLVLMRIYVTLGY